MLKKIKDFFSEELDVSNTIDHERKLKEACAALLIEVSLADLHQSDDELNAISHLLAKEFDLAQEKLDELMQYAKENGKSQTSIHPFTSMVNEHYTYSQKVNLIKLMWKVAFADGDLDKYEDNIIRNIADLLYVSHSDFIKCKLEVSENQ